MSELIKVPDLGGEGEVIEILIKEGDQVEAEQSLAVVESDKASMEIPSPKAGKVKAIKFKLGDSLKEGDPLIELEVEGDEQPKQANSDEKPAKTEPEAAQKQEPKTEDSKPAASASSRSEAVKVPDLGTDSARVIEILVSKGDQVEADQSLLVLESDKASMELPAPFSGVIESIDVKLEQDVKTGDVIMQMQVSGGDSETKAESQSAEQQSKQSDAKQAPAAASSDKASEEPASPPPVGGPSREGAKVHAGPAVRMLAREFGIDLTEVKPTGPRERILKEDVQKHVQAVMQQRKAAPAGAAGGSGIPAVPEVDFSRFGEIETVDMTRLQQVGASNLHRSWLNVPHVTQFDLANISALEAFRKEQKATAEKAGVKLTVLPFLLKACAHLLREQPNFNVSLAANGKQLIQKKYVHIGFAVDTPDGLLVPVIRDVDKKSLLQLAAEAAELADKARNKKLGADAMQGACFTISSLGHIGGTYFTPIVNSPEVAILGVSKATMQPVWDGASFQPQLMLPLSLSYDHRAINGAAAAQFTRRLGELLGDIRTMLL
ncbi:dihydrolipoyllysine-residue acetyltransferase component of pyruvate dehydrogenase complex [Halopseudomonas oceani]|uniref:Acetyltransferase component of pyruvate dehydrogenase complex n=1 Tax=Halopseudomonas oceani TaxID=1708783 RepID=A0A2P4EY19_9GAMM|nr:dihydrolipoyllysine-residue acetyltransferase [Halopseudomonas oceani]POB05114.1 dihydrolipoyllysine-residue acetyltransferase [Halopseudomonas oceani]GGE33249.1 dihydrolipoyllysine-residue acetyltransferase component of pyruvate dehydrogenase complex [Halopseudomonas oceani]